MKYTVDYFIEKFESIPDNKWCTGKLTSKEQDGELHCALGFCDPEWYPEFIRASEESKALALLFNDNGGVKIHKINDLFYKGMNWENSTPKQRILAALHDIKKMNSDKNVQECDATEVEKSVTADTIKTTNEFSPVTFEKITELIPELSNS